MLGSFVAPNWKDVNAYPNEKDTGPIWWAWEFLRRNKAYQEDWQKYASLISERAAPHYDAQRYVEWYLTQTDESEQTLRASFDNPSEYMDYRRDVSQIFREDSEVLLMPPFAPMPESEEEWLRMIDSPLENALGKKWGLKKITPPTSQSIEFGQAAGSGWSRFDIGYRNHLKWTPENERGAEAIKILHSLSDFFKQPNLATVTFDLNMPLDEQLSTVKLNLKLWRMLGTNSGVLEPVKRPKYESIHYANYLRVRDAENAGAAMKEIMRAILPKLADKRTGKFDEAIVKRVEKWKERAKELIDECEYRWLPFVVNKAGKRNATKARKQKQKS